MSKTYNLTTALTLIPEAGSSPDDNFIMENIGNEDVLVCFGNDDGFHPLKAGGSIIRAGVNGDVKAKAATLTAKIVISGI